jgi:hypothetical protein
LTLPLRKNNRESFWSIETRVALVGRSEACHLVLGHESVSRFHASLVRTTKGVWIVDLLAREGVFVNGQSVEWAWLEDGDTVRLGRYTFVFRYESPPAQISRGDVPLEAGARTGPHRGSGSRWPSDGTRDRVTSLAVRARRSIPSFVPVLASPPALSPEVMERQSPANWELSALPPQQVALWQQQMRMMETFHDDMMIMIQMFMAMHREHLGAVKEELEKVRELSSELSQLQEKFAETERTSVGATPENGAPPFSAPGSKQSSFVNGQRQSVESVEAPIAQFVTKRLVESSNPTPQSASNSGLAPSVVASKVRTEARPSLSEESKFHLDITRRITELQRERQGTWQRILSAINKQTN